MKLGMRMIALPRRQQFTAVVMSVCMAAFISACSPQAAETETIAPSAAAEIAVHPLSGLEIIPVKISTKNGEHVIRAEIAATPEQQSRGLMFRTEMGADEGMLFPREDEPRMASFWMRNTVLPLDIIFIGPDRKILNIAADTVPYSEQSVLSDGIAGAVLELNAGRAAELGIAAGDLVDW